MPFSLSVPSLPSPAPPLLSLSPSLPPLIHSSIPLSPSLPPSRPLSRAMPPRPPGTHTPTLACAHKTCVTVQL